MKSMDKCDRCILFDMDGTLVDSYEGIYNAYRWAMEQAGRPFGGHAFVKKAIGAPLMQVMTQLCGMDQAQARQAVGDYRAYYARLGKRQAKAYPGMEETLRRLKEAGCFVGAATLKNEGFAKEILQQLGLAPYFDIVCGMDQDDRLTKAALIRRCMAAAGALAEETVLVGDSAFDAQGAKEAGVKFLAVTYGFGFRQPEELQKYGISNPARSPGEILQKLSLPRAM